MKYQKKNLHHHRCWTSLWQQAREDVLRVWSRVNLEGRSTAWTARDVLPATIVVTGEIEYGDEQRWTCEAKALQEAMLWKTC